jgi:hypothetical protein
MPVEFRGLIQDFISKTNSAPTTWLKPHSKEPNRT